MEIRFYIASTLIEKVNIMLKYFRLLFFLSDQRTRSASLYGYLVTELIAK